MPCPWAVKEVDVAEIVRMLTIPPRRCYSETDNVGRQSEEHLRVGEKARDVKRLVWQATDGANTMRGGDWHSNKRTASASH